MTSVRGVLPLTPNGYDCGDIAVTAAEGGIGYWAMIDRYDWRNWDGRDVPENYVFYSVVDVEGPRYEGEDWLPVTPAVIRRGLNLYRVQVEELRDPTDIGAMDAGEADCVIQFGLFGEVRYS